MGTTAAVGASALAARNVNVTRNANAVQRSLNARPINRALNNTVALRDPRTRAFITASVATAAWHGGNWWWRHRNGGFGWVGPLFWPFAFYDIYDYAFWGYPYDDAFWGYGYPDLYAGIFGLYGYDDLMGYAGYLPRDNGVLEVRDLFRAPLRSLTGPSQLPSGRGPSRRLLTAAATTVRPSLSVL